MTLTTGLELASFDNIKQRLYPSGEKMSSAIETKITKERHEKEPWFSVLKKECGEGD